jgi:hypothetical protein
MERSGGERGRKGVFSLLLLEFSIPRCHPSPPSIPLPSGHHLFFYPDDRGSRFVQNVDYQVE